VTFRIQTVQLIEHYNIPSLSKPHRDFSNFYSDSIISLMIFIITDL